MKTKKELRKKRTLEYLEEILSRRSWIFNPTRLDIPEFGRVTATSMVNYHVNDGKLVPYFTFKKSRKESGEFFRENNRYFIRYDTTGGRK